MPLNPNHDHDVDRDRDDEPKPEKQAIALTPKEAALASTALTALSTALSNVVRSAAVGRSSLPILSFKSREEGKWTIGQRGIIVEEGTRVAVNFNSLRHGYICFSDNNENLGERLVPASQPKPLVTELPDHGFPWQEQLAVNVKLIDGADAGSEAAYKPTTVGGKDALLGVIDATFNRIHSDQFDGKNVPIVRLGRDSYQHQRHGRIWVPLLTITDWMFPEGPAPASVSPPPPQPAPTTPTDEQPRRRRVA
jgi:hypothetical protein